MKRINDEQAVLLEAKLRDVYAEYNLTDKEKDEYNKYIEKYPYLQKVMERVLKFVKKDGEKLPIVIDLFKELEYNKSKLDNKDLLSPQYKTIDDYRDALREKKVQPAAVPEPEPEKEAPKEEAKAEAIDTTKAPPPESDVSAYMKYGLEKFKDTCFLFEETAEYFVILLGSYPACVYFTKPVRQKTQEMGGQGWCIGAPTTRGNYDTYDGVFFLVAYKSGYEKDCAYRIRSGGGFIRHDIMNRDNSTDIHSGLTKRLYADPRVKNLVETRAKLMNAPLDTIALFLLRGEEIKDAKDIFAIILKEKKIELSEEELAFLSSTQGMGYSSTNAMTLLPTYILEEPTKDALFYWRHRIMGHSHLSAELCKDLYNTKITFSNKKVLFYSNDSNGNYVLMNLGVLLKKYDCKIGDIIDENFMTFYAAGGNRQFPFFYSLGIEFADAKDIKDFFSFLTKEEILTSKLSVQAGNFGTVPLFSQQKNVVSNSQYWLLNSVMAKYVLTKRGEGGDTDKTTILEGYKPTNKYEESVKLINLENMFGSSLFTDGEVLDKTKIEAMDEKTIIAIREAVDKAEVRKFNVKAASTLETILLTYREILGDEEKIKEIGKMLLKYSRYESNYNAKIVQVFLKLDAKKLGYINTLLAIKGWNLSQKLVDVAYDAFAVTDISSLSETEAENYISSTLNYGGNKYYQPRTYTGMGLCFVAFKAIGETNLSNYSHLFKTLGEGVCPGVNEGTINVQKVLAQLKKYAQDLKIVSEMTGKTPPPINSNFIRLLPKYTDYQRVNVFMLGTTNYEGDGHNNGYLTEEREISRELPKLFTWEFFKKVLSFPITKNMEVNKDNFPELILSMKKKYKTEDAILEFLDKEKKINPLTILLEDESLIEALKPFEDYFFKLTPEATTKLAEMSKEFSEEIKALLQISYNIGRYGSNKVTLNTADVDRIYDIKEVLPGLKSNKFAKVILTGKETDYYSFVGAKSRVSRFFSTVSNGGNPYGHNITLTTRPDLMKALSKLPDIEKLDKQLEQASGANCWNWMWLFNDPDKEKAMLDAYNFAVNYLEKMVLIIRGNYTYANKLSQNTQASKNAAIKFFKHAPWIVHNDDHNLSVTLFKYFFETHGRTIEATLKKIDKLGLKNKAYALCHYLNGIDNPKLIKAIDPFMPELMAEVKTYDKILAYLKDITTDEKLAEFEETLASGNLLSRAADEAYLKKDLPMWVKNSVLLDEDEGYFYCFCPRALENYFPASVKEEIRFIAFSKTKKANNLILYLKNGKMVRPTRGRGDNPELTKKLIDAYKKGLDEFKYVNPDVAGRHTYTGGMGLHLWSDALIPPSYYEKTIKYVMDTYKEDFITVFVNYYNFYGIDINETFKAYVEKNGNTQVVRSMIRNSYPPMGPIKNVIIHYLSGIFILLSIAKDLESFDDIGSNYNFDFGNLPRIRLALLTYEGKDMAKEIFGLRSLNETNIDKLNVANNFNKTALKGLFNLL